MGLLLSVGGAAVFTLGAFDSVVRAVLVSLSVGFGLIGLLYALADVSGGHFNPAVTIGAWIAGRHPTREVVPYLLAQVAGGVLGMGIIAGIASANATTFPYVQSQALASQCYTAGSVACSGYGWTAAFLIEAAFTFVLVLAILASTRSEGSARNLAPLGIGLTLVMTNLVAIPVDGASINPARSFAPAVLSVFWSRGQWAIGQDWLFWIAPIVGGVVAALVERALRPQGP